MLAEDGFESEMRFDGAAAIARLAIAPMPTVLIVDYLLPHVDGMAVALYARSRDPAIPVIIVSSYEEIVRLMPPLDPPAVMISKPLPYAELTRELAGALRRDRPSGAQTQVSHLSRHGLSTSKA